MSTRNRVLIILLSFFLLGHTALIGQNNKKEKMEALSFLIGDWVGTSKILKNGLVEKEVPAFQKISYDLNQHIIVIELQSELLQLHTIIYFDEETSQYMYNPFSEKGVRKYPAELIDGKFIVSASEKNRFVFSRKSENTFQEYGESLKDGKWIRYFEDNFTDIQ